MQPRKFSTAKISAHTVSCAYTRSQAPIQNGRISEKHSITCSHSIRDKSTRNGRTNKSTSRYQRNSKEDPKVLRNSRNTRVMSCFTDTKTTNPTLSGQTKHLPSNTCLSACPAIYLISVRGDGLSIL